MQSRLLGGGARASDMEAKLRAAHCTAVAAAAHAQRGGGVLAPLSLGTSNCLGSDMAGAYARPAAVSYHEQVEATRAGYKQQLARRMSSRPF